MQRTSFADMACSIARTLDVAGEPWTPLILRDVFVGIRRFGDIQADLGVSSKVLADRLRRLVDDGVLEASRYCERPVRNEYVLTRKGAELIPILMAMTAWGDRWAAGPEGPPLLLRHRTCGQLTQAEVRCARCGGELHAADVSTEPGPGAAPPMAAR